MKIKVLFLAANPLGTTKLSLDRESRTITDKIRASEHREQLEMAHALAARPDDLLQALNEHKPHIVHFSGHGTKAEEIVLCDDSGQPKPVSKAALRHLFKVLKGNTQVVILNACFSQPQAEAITEHIPCAIGMNESIGDAAAIVFAGSFYRAIGFGLSVQEAFDQGIAALLLEGIEEDDIPQLIPQDGVDPASIVLVNSAPSSQAQMYTNDLITVGFDEHWTFEDAARKIVGAGKQVDMKGFSKDQLRATLLSSKLGPMPLIDALRRLGALAKNVAMPEYEVIYNDPIYTLRTKALADAGNSDTPASES